MQALSLDIRNVSKTYSRRGASVMALQDVSFKTSPGEAIAIMGPSGSGKTTLLNILSGLDRPSGGRVLLEGTEFRQLSPDQATTFRRRRVGFVFQFFNLLPAMSALDNVALPLLAERITWREVRDRASEALEAVGLKHRANHLPDEMSGGEQQRVAVARAMVMRPKILLADEPTGNLDTTSGNDVLSLLRRAVDQEHTTLVMVTHSAAAAAVADRVLVLRDGRIVTNQ